jgi:hypothetical protein
MASFELNTMIINPEVGIYRSRLIFPLFILQKLLLAKIIRFEFKTLFDATDFTFIPLQGVKEPKPAKKTIDLF